MQLTRVAILIGAAGVACSSSSSFTDPSGGTFGSAGGGVARPSEDFGPNGSSGVTPSEPRCPSDAPAANASCNVPGVVCPYGPDVRADCNDTFECSGGRWRHTTPKCAADCPKTIDAIKPGTACPDARVACSYDEGTCGCVADEVPSPPPANDAGSDGGDAGDGGFTYVPVPGQWKCVAPPTTVACPSARPRVLDSCVKRVECDYGSCELGRPLSYSCESGFWNEPTFAGACDP